MRRSDSEASPKPHSPAPAASARPQRSRVWLRRFLATVVGLALALVLAELGLRVRPPAAIERLGLEGSRSSPLHPRAGLFQLHPELGYSPVMDGALYTELGTLVNDYAEAKPADVQRLLFLGDSATKRGQIVAACRRLFGEEGFEYWNAGVEGYNTEQEVLYYETFCRRTNADHVVLVFHLNDFAFTSVMFLDENEGLVSFTPTVSVSVDPWLLEHSHLYRFYIAMQLRESPDDDEWPKVKDGMRESLRTLVELTASRGAELTVLVLPIFLPRDKWRYRFRFRHGEILEMLRELEIVHHDLAVALDEALQSGVDVREAQRDIHHPSAAFARSAAEQLQREGFLAPR